MRYIILLTVFAFSVILTKSATDKVCLEESDEEVCESIHVQCGVTARIENTCGIREILCSCHDGSICSLETLKCE